jgi:hypothetical protein
MNYCGLKSKRRLGRKHLSDWEKEKERKEKEKEKNERKKDEKRWCEDELSVRLISSSWLRFSSLVPSS